MGTGAIPVEAILFDRDGTLIEDIPYNGDAIKVAPMAGAVVAVAAVRARGLKTGVVTNQSGVARGLIQLAEVESVNRRVDELFGRFDTWGVCPHGPDDGCSCRKPAPGLVVEAAVQLGVRPQHVVVVGDRRADLGAASAAGAVAVLLPSERTEPGAAVAADHLLSEMCGLDALLDALLGCAMTDASSSVAHELHALRGAEVLVLGDVMLDRYVHGEVQRVSPEAPVPVLLQQGTRLALGGAANVAANIASVGAQATLIGRVGEDNDASDLVAMLDALHLRHDLLTVPGVSTITKTRIVAGAQQLTRIDNESIHTTTPEQATAILRSVREFVSQHGHRAVVLADYAKGFLETSLIREVIRLSDEADVPVVTDPKGQDFARYAGSTVIKPNLAEAWAACAVVKLHASRLEEIASLADACLKVSGARNVVLSCSADGVAVLGVDSPELTQLPTNARDVVDVSGAGDTLVALVALGLAAQLPLRRAVEIGNWAAGAVCGKSGTATVTAIELLGLIDGETRSSDAWPSPKILASRHEAGEIGTQYRAEGRRLVFANGCFDLLHAGHIRLLQHARSLGDALIVALNADESVRRLKGAGRPIQSEDDRCEIIAALACVDFVVLFEEDTPLELITAVRPSVLVKGDDYSVESVVGASEVEAWGGTVVLVPRLDGRSTTRIIESSQ